MKVKILTDSICDLTPELLARYDIDVVPLTIVLGDTPYKDGLEIKPADIFDFVGNGKGTSQTTAINIGEYHSIYEKSIAGGAEGIIHFILSSELSAGYHNAVVAANEFENIYPIDTKSLSAGSGWLALYAGELLDAGDDLKTVAQKVNEKIDKADASFVIDTLHYLHKGGRCGGLTALGANLLNLKPCLELRDGRIEVGKKYRGAIEKVLYQYIEERVKARDNLDLSRCFITHTFPTDEIPNAMRELVLRLQPGFREVLITPAGCTISNHCGPKTLGILLYRK
jgi:DegV family protein with EDD domain